MSRRHRQGVALAPRPEHTNEPGRVVAISPLSIQSLPGNRAIIRRRFLCLLDEGMQRNQQLARYQRRSCVLSGGFGPFIDNTNISPTIMSVRAT
jgi:hypothetical protein